MRKRMTWLVALAALLVGAAMLQGCGGKAEALAPVWLTWTAPGDDGNVGTAAEYDIRYHDQPITDDNWNDATQVDGEPTPSPAGSPEQYQLPTLQSGTYWVAIKARDEAYNWSALSNSAQFEVDEIEPAAITDLEAQPAP